MRHEPKTIYPLADVAQILVRQGRISRLRRASASGEEGTMTNTILFVLIALASVATAFFQLGMPIAACITIAVQLGVFVFGVTRP